MSTHAYRTIDVPVRGGDLRVGVWDPEGPVEHTILAIHGVTSSHLAWPQVVQELPGVRVIAPDLRGRGASNTLTGPAGMAAHAADMIAVLDAMHIDRTVVVGHSMGAFVSVVLAATHPSRVERIVLVDGGMPLDVPPGVSPEDLVQVILGPVAERLARRWRDVDEYASVFWRDHPAFADDWSRELEEYIAYDLVPAEDGDGFRAATSYQTMAEDTLDMNTGSALTEALDALRVPTLFVTVPRGLQNEEPGLYSPSHLADILTRFPELEHRHLDDLNHYTIVMSQRGAAALAPLLRGELARLT